MLKQLQTGAGALFLLVLGSSLVALSKAPLWLSVLILAAVGSLWAAAGLCSWLQQRRADRAAVLSLVQDADAYSAGFVEHVPRTLDVHSQHLRLPYSPPPTMKLHEGVRDRCQRWLTPRLLDELEGAVRRAAEAAANYGNADLSNVVEVGAGHSRRIGFVLHYQIAESVWQGVSRAVDAIVKAGRLDYLPRLPVQLSVEEDQLRRRGGPGAA